MSDTKPLLSISIDCEPKPQPRVRAFAKKFGEKWTARVYTKGTAEAFKSAIAIAARPFVPAQPHGRAMTMRLVIRLARPNGHYSTAKNACGALKPTAPPDWQHENTPDFDNVLKAVLDVFSPKGIGFWVDDRLVCKCTVEKRWATRGGIEMMVWTATAQDGTETDATILRVRVAAVIHEARVLLAKWGTHESLRPLGDALKRYEEHAGA